MIVYVDSSVVVRSYLVDEPDHPQVRALFDDPQLTTITGSWTRVEVTGSLVRAARAHRGDEESLLELFERDLDPATGELSVIDANQAEIEGIALEIVRRTGIRSPGIRSRDAWHLACASLTLAELAEPGEERAFATRDDQQAAVARELGFTVL